MYLHDRNVIHGDLRSVSYAVLSRIAQHHSLSVVMPQSYSFSLLG